MIHKDTFQFLHALKANNSKEWFDSNRSLYLLIRKHFEALVESAIATIAQFDKEASRTTSRDCIFRINRDIRFSKDKSPYKTNLGAFIAKGGRKGMHAGYYVHIEPGSSFLAGGIYMPASPVLKAIRTEIYENIDDFREITNSPTFTRHFGKELWGEKLKSTPKGFPKNFPYVDYLKYKHYTIAKNEPDDLIINQDYLQEIHAVFKAMYPFNRFLNHAVEEWSGQTGY